jgi:hypothetical protein
VIILETALKILFLDDEKVRHELFERWCPDADHCYTYESCIQLLSMNKYDVVSLDHDLKLDYSICSAHRVPVRDCPRCEVRIPAIGERNGVDIAKFIVGLVQKPSVAIVHSFNPTGAKQMVGLLASAGIKTYRIPFGMNPDVYKSLKNDSQAKA